LAQGNVGHSKQKFTFFFLSHSQLFFMKAQFLFLGLQPVHCDRPIFWAVPFVVAKYRMHTPQLIPQGATKSVRSVIFSPIKRTRAPSLFQFCYSFACFSLMRPNSLTSQSAETAFSRPAETAGTRALSMSGEKPKLFRNLDRKLYISQRNLFQKQHLCAGP
jgi:hypothetical protein